MGLHIRDVEFETGKRMPFLGFVEDAESRAVLSRLAAAQGWGEGCVLSGGIADAVHRLSLQATPAVLVVDISQSSDPPAQIEDLANHCDPGTSVIALGAVNDIALYRALMAMGISDYLVKPVSPASLAEAIERAVAPTQPSSPAVPEIERTGGKVFAVIGARGGVGATTTAVNLAWTMARKLGRRTALIDLDIYYGSVALSLDLEPGHGFREALENPDRIDGLFVERAMVRAADNLLVLAAEENLDDKAFSFAPAALDLLLKTLTSGFESVVIDMPRFAARTQLAVLQNSAAAIVISDRSLPGLRDTLRIVQHGASLATGPRMDIVLNEPLLPNGNAISRAEFEKGSGAQVIGEIPHDPKAMADSAAAGTAIQSVTRGSKSQTAIEALARRLVLDGSAASRKPLWRRFLGMAG